MSALKAKLTSSEPCSRSLIWIMYKRRGQQPGCASVSSLHLKGRWNVPLGWPSRVSQAPAASSSIGRAAGYPSLPFFPNFPSFSRFYMKPSCTNVSSPETLDQNVEVGAVLLGKCPRSQHRLAPTLPKTCLKMSVPGFTAALLGCWAGTCLYAGRLWDGCWNHPTGRDADLRTIPSAPHRSAPCHRLCMAPDDVSLVRALSGIWFGFAVAPRSLVALILMEDESVAGVRWRQSRPRAEWSSGWRRFLDRASSPAAVSGATC